jgi:hypothetical protein
LDNFRVLTYIGSFHWAKGETGRQSCWQQRLSTELLTGEEFSPTGDSIVELLT